MSTWSVTYKQSVIKPYHNDKHFSDFAYKMAAKINWHRYGTIITSLSPYVYRGRRTDWPKRTLAIPSRPIGSVGLSYEDCLGLRGKINRTINLLHASVSCSCAQRWLCVLIWFSLHFECFYVSWLITSLSYFLILFHVGSSVVSLLLPTAAASETGCECGLWRDRKG